MAFLATITVMNEVEISLFPIPGSVSLPYSTTSLHVFEPRYRQMIKDSIENQRRVGVAHTLRVISDGKSSPQKPLDEILSSNQKTYEAYPIFSAGFVKIRETLPDGRLMVEIEMDARFKIKSEIQHLPYKIVLCEPFVDDDNVVDSLARTELDQALIDLSQGEAKDLKLFIKSPEWKKLSFDEYSFKIFSIVSFEPDVLQKVLELKSAQRRVQFLKDILTRLAVH